MRKLLPAGLLLAVMLALTGCGAKITGITAPETLSLETGKSASVVLAYEYEKPDTKTEDKAKAEAALKTTWQSSDAAIATVDEKGGITGIASGEASITATSGAMSAVCKISVTAPPTWIEMPKSTYLTINGSDSAELKAKLLPEGATPIEIVYTSNDDKVATVDANGKIIAIGKGTATITATVGVVKAETEVNVTIAATEIKLDKTEGALTVGGSVTLRPTLTPADAETAAFTWVSSDEKIASVKDGVITAKAAGKATITVNTKSGLKAEYTLTVQKKPVASANKPYNNPANGAGTTLPPSEGVAQTPTLPPAPTPPRLGEDGQPVGNSPWLPAIDDAGNAQGDLS
ncbi:MAG: Ig-like domain-containing protein [Oscillospiraceae bacterium]